jgi:hypothetical protein
MFMIKFEANKLPLTQSRVLFPARDLEDEPSKDDILPPEEPVSLKSKVSRDKDAKP